MSLSARNRLSGTVTAVEYDDIMAEVEIELPGGEAITATITTASCERLGLSEGDEVDAVVKASSVMIDA